MLAQHYLTGEKFAIKMIDKRVYDDRVMSRLVREISIMEALNHPNIVRLYETFETACTLYLVMEYIPGVNLDEYLKQMGGSLKEQEARMIFRQVVAAVDYCHQKWVVHRDLKAPNILLTRNNQVHLVDFGLSNRFGLQRLRTICGSMLYYSPEIINGKKYIGPEVDCWCLGICLFRMVAGFEAFAHAKTIGELRKDILNRNYPMPGHFSDGLKRTIQKCLSTDRRKRSSLCNALQGDPWINDYGRLDDLFSEGSNYHAAMYQFAVPSSMSVDAISLEARQQERDQQQRQFLRDMEEEKRTGYQVRKTLIHHAHNPAYYYTSHGRREDRSLLEPIRAALYQEIRSVLNQISLCPVNHIQLSISDAANQKQQQHSIKHRGLMKKTSSLNISQLYQRTKDKTYYFTIQSNVRAISSTTVVSMTSSTSSPTYLDDQRVPSSAPVDQAQDEFELVLLVRSVCELLGVTYLHESRSQLSCMLTLCNYKEQDVLERRKSSPSAIPRKSSLKQLFSASTSTPTLLKRKSFSNNSLYPESIIHSLDINEDCNPTASNNSHWWLRQLQRLALPHSNVLQLNNRSLRHSSSAHSMRLSSTDGTRNQTVENDKKIPTTATDGTALFSIEVNFIPSKQNTRLLALRFTKVSGSTRVYKLATGWIASILQQQKGD
ncbi:kinase-like domain-containing protein [Halteromyces radiatus]|uniref:kinase-like domain-containing protein n=1 Tax=Halteromyces radiatus TaxID=101107 RepID=UPI0022203921|nr:kinase-like domain-containing protein [Halteromyces radiatus]KAI8084972.1 kinase-like domain-containing protein [Halteromyces radiatus]